jgi:multicomponent Na+:H+ antiporter subunit C
MIVANYLTAAALFSLGAFSIMASRNLIKIVLGLSLMESSTYLLLVSMAYRSHSTAPVLSQPPKGVSTEDLANGRRIADPVLQNFCLTAIVIGVAVTAVFLAVVVRVTQHHRTIDAARIRQLHG